MSVKKRAARKSVKPSAPEPEVFCTGPPLKRVNYFTAQLLTADDFTAEQNYHLEKHRRHNRMCHGCGIVQGLKVSVAEEKRDWVVIVNPGFAIDAAGNEIQVGAEARLPMPKAQAGTQTETSLFVIICYKECLSDPVPIPGEPCTKETESEDTVHYLHYSRVQEEFELLLSEDANANPPAPTPDPRGQACPPHRR